MLLFDQNISFKVAKKIQDLFPGSRHLSDLQLDGHKDIEIWEFAKANNFCIVTFDFDFIEPFNLKRFSAESYLASIRKHHDRKNCSSTSIRLNINYGLFSKRGHGIFRN